MSTFVMSASRAMFWFHSALSIAMLSLSNAPTVLPSSPTGYGCSFMSFCGEMSGVLTFFHNWLPGTKQQRVTY